MDRSASLFNLTGKVALVTGASSGLGRRAAVALTEAGAKVIGVARRAEALEKLASELGEQFSSTLYSFRMPDIAFSLNS